MAHAKLVRHIPCCCWVSPDARGRGKWDREEKAYLLCVWWGGEGSGRRGRERKGGTAGPKSEQSTLAGSRKIDSGLGGWDRKERCKRNFLSGLSCGLGTSSCWRLVWRGQVKWTDKVSKAKKMYINV
jgi:hypothetical protein